MRFEAFERGRVRIVHDHRQTALLRQVAAHGFPHDTHTQKPDLFKSTLHLVRSIFRSSSLRIEPHIYTLGLLIKSKSRETFFPPETALLVSAEWGRYGQL